MWLFSYWLLPFMSAIVWLAMLLTMLLYWLANGRRRFASMDPGQKVAYISDVGAFDLKPLFITGSCVVTILLDASFIAERWLRHKGILAKNTGKTEKVVVTLSFIFAFLGTVGLILLSIFDTYNHSSLHRLFLLFFLAGYVISAICICIEYQRLGIHFRQFRILRISFWTKLAFIIIEVGLAIGFIACLYTNRWDQGAVLEWVIAFIFTFYILVFLIDLLPATRKKHHHLLGHDTTEKGAAGTSSQAGHATHGPDRDMAENEAEAGYTRTPDYSNRQWPPTQSNGVHEGSRSNGYAAGPAQGHPTPVTAQNF